MSNLRLWIVLLQFLVGVALAAVALTPTVRRIELPRSALSVARHYQDLLDGFVLDQQDAALAPA